MSMIPWKKVHKPGGVAISAPLISSRITKEQQDPTRPNRYGMMDIHYDQWMKQKKSPSSLLTKFV